MYKKLFVIVVLCANFQLSAMQKKKAAPVRRAKQTLVRRAVVKPKPKPAPGPIYAGLSKKAVVKKPKPSPSTLFTSFYAEWRASGCGGPGFNHSKVHDFNSFWTEFKASGGTDSPSFNYSKVSDMNSFYAEFRASGGDSPSFNYSHVK